MADTTAERRLKRVYIAGPITLGPPAENLNKAVEAFVALGRRGTNVAPWCPQLTMYTANPATPHPSDPERSIYTVGHAGGHPALEHADWLRIDLAWVAVADAVLRLPGASAGADREVFEATSRGIPVFYTVESVIAWAVAAVPDSDWSCQL